MGIESMTVRELANCANPNNFPSILKAGFVGNVLQQYIPRELKEQVPAVSYVTLAAVAYDGVALPTYCKASRIRRAWARAVTAPGATLGEMTIAAVGAAPAANQIGVSPAGDVITLGTDVYSLVDVEYEPVVGNVIELTGLTVIPGSGVCALPARITALYPHKLIAARAVTGGTTGACTPDWRADIAPATTYACLNNAGTQVLFAIADAVTSANVTLIVSSDVDIQSMLTDIASGI